MWWCTRLLHSDSLILCTNKLDKKDGSSQRRQSSASCMTLISWRDTLSMPSASLIYFLWIQHCFIREQDVHLPPSDSSWEILLATQSAYYISLCVCVSLFRIFFIQAHVYFFSRVSFLSSIITLHSETQNKLISGNIYVSLRHMEMEILT